MNHDELQQRVNDLYTNVNEENPTRAEESKAHYALRAVVELHKPEHSIRGYRCIFDDELFPCKHHQAIEKELE
jgi:hypothetical protein